MSLRNLQAPVLSPALLLLELKELWELGALKIRFERCFDPLKAGALWPISEAVYHSLHLTIARRPANKVKLCLFWDQRALSRPPSNSPPRAQRAKQTICNFTAAAHRKRDANLGPSLRAGSLPTFSTHLACCMC
jgi:hypothetical protein